MRVHDNSCGEHFSRYKMCGTESTRNSRVISNVTTAPRGYIYLRKATLFHKHTAPVVGRAFPCLLTVLMGVNILRLPGNVRSSPLHVSTGQSFLSTNLLCMYVYLQPRESNSRAYLAQPITLQTRAPCIRAWAAGPTSGRRYSSDLAQSHRSNLDCLDTLSSFLGVRYACLGPMNDPSGNAPTSIVIQLSPGLNT